jgi:hypothetical protein
MLYTGSARRGSFCSADRTCLASRPAVLGLPITAPLLLRAYSVTRVCFCREMAFLQVVCVISISFRLGWLNLFYCGLVHIIRDICRRVWIIISNTTTYGQYRGEILYAAMSRFKMYIIHSLLAKYLIYYILTASNKFSYTFIVWYWTLYG